MCVRHSLRRGSSFKAESSGYAELKAAVEQVAVEACSAILPIGDLEGARDTAAELPVVPHELTLVVVALPSTLNRPSGDDPLPPSFTDDDGMIFVAPLDRHSRPVSGNSGGA